MHLQGTAGCATHPQQLRAVFDDAVVLQAQQRANERGIGLQIALEQGGVDDPAELEAILALFWRSLALLACSLGEVDALLRQVLNQRLHRRLQLRALEMRDGHRI